MRNSYSELLHEYSMSLKAMKYNDLSYIPHYHSHIEILYILDGEIVIGVNGVRKYYSTGDIIICGKNAVHFFDSTNMKNSVLVLQFEYGLLDDSFRDIVASIGFTSTFLDDELIHSCGLRIKLRDLFLECYEDSLTEPAFTSLIIKAKLELILLYILRAVEKYKNQLIELRDTKNHNLMNEIIDFIEHNHVDGVSLESISESFYLCKFYFSKMFRKLFGINFKDYVNHVRLQKARSLLSMSGNKISSTALECGFGSVRQFNRYFKDNTGQTPSEYRSSRSISKST